VDIGVLARRDAPHIEGKVEMAKVIVHHEVKDFDAWLEVFNAVEGLRRESGERSHEVFRAEDNPNFVTAIVEYTSLDAAKAWFSNDELKAKMMEAGVVGAPAIHFLADA